MLFSVEDIIRDVRITINENANSEALAGIGDVDTLELDELIRSKVADAATWVEKRAPVYLLGTGAPFADSLYWDDEAGIGSGYTILPDDFMRLIRFRMSDWKTTVFNAISADDPNYLVQSSEFAGLRGNPERPMCAIVSRPEGLALEFFSCVSGEECKVDSAQYMPYPIIDMDDNIDISEQCYHAIVDCCAGMVFESLNNSSQAEIFFKLSTEKIV